MNIDYTLWPNTDGNLGNIKVQIPTGTDDDKWPEGDALVGNFVYKDGKLVGFVDNKALTVNESKTTTIDYDYCDIELPFTEGEMTINRGPRSKYFNVRYVTTASGEEVALIRFEDMDEDTRTLLRSAAKIVDNTLYDASDNVIGTFDTSKLATGTNIVIELPLSGPPYSSDGKEMDGLFTCLDMGAGEYIRELPLTIFNSSLKSVTNGNTMFIGCPNLTTFEGDLSSLIHAYAMFGACFSLTSFKSNLSSLVFAYMMFTQSQFLASFEADLSSLANGAYMFEYCSDLTSFKSNLKSLTNGYKMFLSCKLDTESVQLIADTINDVNSLTNSGSSDGEVYKQINIGIANSTPNEQEVAAFQQMAAKGWKVIAAGKTYNPTSPAAIITLDENGEEITTPIPFYAKPVPATERTANYVDANGNYFDIVGGQFIYGDDLSTYGMFTCEADAAANMRLTKIEKPQMLSVNR